MFAKCSFLFRARLASLTLAFAMVLAVGSAVLVPSTSWATLTFSAAARSAQMTGVNSLLAGGTIEVWSGAKPSALGAPAGTKLATLTLGSPAGTVASGVLTIGAVTQTNSSHVSGTPTFIRFKDSGGAVVADIDIGSGAGTVSFTGTVATGQNVTVTGLTLTAGNP